MAGKPGRGGRPRKPTALRILEGDFEKNPQRKRKGEPKPKVGEPKCPTWLKGEAKRERKRIVQLLTNTGVLTEDDGPAIEAYAIHWAGWRHCQRMLEEHGTVVVNAQGNLVRSPWAIEFHAHAAFLHKWLTEFGLTPASRTRVQVTQETENKSEKAERYLA